jgi:hypothetical protein
VITNLNNIPHEGILNSVNKVCVCTVHIHIRFYNLGGFSEDDYFKSEGEAHFRDHKEEAPFNVELDGRPIEEPERSSNRLHHRIPKDPSVEYDRLGFARQ